MPIRVAIVEDDLKFLEGVSLMLGDSPSIKVVGKFTRGRDAIQGILEKRPDVALVDLELPDISGAEVIKAVLEKGCGTELLVLSCWEDDGHLFSALRAGAGGYIVKNEASRVVKAIEEVVNGGAPMSMGIARRVLSSRRSSDKTKGRSFRLLQGLPGGRRRCSSIGQRGLTPKRWQRCSISAMRPYASIRRTSIESSR